MTAKMKQQTGILANTHTQEKICKNVSICLYMEACRYVIKVKWLRKACGKMGMTCVTLRVEAQWRGCTHIHVDIYLDMHARHGISAIIAIMVLRQPTRQFKSAWRATHKTLNLCGRMHYPTYMYIHTYIARYICLFYA